MKKKKLSYYVKELRAAEELYQYVVDGMISCAPMFILSLGLAVRELELIIDDGNYVDDL